MVTFLRHPLDMVISFYKYGKQRGFGVSLSLETYLNAVCLKKNLLEYSYLPFNPRENSSIEQMEEKFIFVGIFERYQESVDILARLIGRDRVQLPWENVGLEPHESCSEQSLKIFQDAFACELSFYNYWNGLLNSYK